MEKYMKNVTTFISVLLAILMTAVPTECLSQNDAVEIRGQVTAENKDAIEGVSVFVTVYISIAVSIAITSCISFINAISKSRPMYSFK